MDELPDHPLVSGTGSIDAGSRQRAGHHLSLVLDVQQILAQLQNFLGAGDPGVAEVELAGEGASLDEVVLGRVQVKNPEAELVDHLHGAAGQPAIIQAAELQQRNWHLDNPGLGDLKKVLPAHRLAQRRQPMAD